jgi:hypothetical protein
MSFYLLLDSDIRADFLSVDYLLFLCTEDPFFELYDLMLYISLKEFDFLILLRFSESG